MPRDFVNILRLSAALAALTLTASTTCAAVTGLSNAMGPSGGYTTQAWYQATLGGQPMTAAQQAYSNQEDQLRQMGFLSEQGGDFALGQMFYHIAYGLTPGTPLALDWDNLESGPLSWLLTQSAPLSSIFAPSGSAAGASGSGDTSSAVSSVVTDLFDTSDSVTLTAVEAPPVSGFAAPEASTWAMMLVGFASLGAAGWREARKAKAQAA